MKKIFALLCFVAMCNSWSAEAVFKIEINGSISPDKRVELSTNNNGIAMRAQSWHKKENQACTLYGYTKLSDGIIKPVTVSFNAQNSGIVNVYFTGGWNDDPRQREFVYIADVTLNGKTLLPKRETDKGEEKNNCVKTPEGFTCIGNAKFISEAENTESIAMVVNQDNRIKYLLNVKKGNTYTFTMNLMPAKEFTSQAKTIKLLPFSGEWSAFLNVKEPENYAAIPTVLDSPVFNQVQPQRIKNKFPNLTEYGTMIDLGQFTEKLKERAVAILYNEFDSPEETKINATFAADWWMELYLNGERILTTVETGNIAPTTTHPAVLKLRKGKNIFAAKILSGSRGWSFRFASALPTPPPITFRQDKNWKPVFMHENQFEIVGGSALDLSAHIDAPAGKYGRVIATQEGTLVFSGKPERTARFKGFSSGLPDIMWRKPDTDSFKGYARRMAIAVRRQGYNLFRDHGIDGWIMTGSEQALNFSEEYMKRWDYLFFLFKEQGIYWQHVIFSFGLYEPEKDYNTALKNRDAHKLMMCVGRDFERKRFKEGASRFLDHVNPHTGIKWKDDPALILVEFYNERYSGFERISKTQTSNPEEYKFFHDKWTEYLKQRFSELPQEKWPPELRKTGLQKPHIFTTFGVTPEFIQETVRFRISCLEETNKWCEKIVREAGYNGLITQNGSSRILNAASLWSTVNFADSHTYYKHPLNGSNPGSIVGQQSAVAEVASYFRDVNAQKLYGRPFGVGEYNHCFWNEYQREMPLVFTAYAAFQNYSTLAIHSHPVMIEGLWTGSRVSCFGVASNPVLRGGEFVGNMLFLRGDISPSRHKIMLNITDKYLLNRQNGFKAVSSEQNKLSLLTNFGIAFPDRPLASGVATPTRPDFALNISGGADVYNHDWFSSTVSTVDKEFSLSEIVKELKNHGILSPQNITDPDKGIFESDTGQIILHSRDKYIQIVTPMTQAVAVKAGANSTLKDFSLESTSTDTLAAVTSIDDSIINTSKHLVLVLATTVANEGMQLDARNPSKLIKLGKGPVLMRTGKFKVTIKNKNAKNIKCYALDCAGRRIQEITVIADDTSLKLDIDTSSLKFGPTPFFELVSE